MSVVKFRCSATAVSWDGKRTEAGPHLDCCQSRARPGTGVPPHSWEQSQGAVSSQHPSQSLAGATGLYRSALSARPAMGSSHQRLWRRPPQLALPLNLLLLLLLLPTQATPLPAATRSSSLERTDEDGVLAKDTAGGLREERLMELLTQAVKEGIRHKIERLCNISEKVSFSGSDDSPSSNVLVRTKNNFIKELCPDIGDRCRKYPRPPPDVRVVAPTSHWTVGDVAWYECLAGYLFSTGVTEVTSTCQTDGWSQLIFPSCVRDPCLVTNGTCAGGTCSHVCTAGICSASCVCPEGTVLFEGQCVSDPCRGMPCGGPEVTLGVTVERDPDSGQPWCRCHCRPAALNINNRCLDCWSSVGGRPPLCPCDSDSNCDRRVTLSGTGRPVRAGFCLRGACFDCGQFPADSPELPLGCLVQPSVIAPPANSPQQPPVSSLPAPQESNVLFHVPMATVVPAMPIKETPDTNTLLTTSTHLDTATDSSIHPNKENSTGSPGPTSEPQNQTVPEEPTPQGQEPEAETSETTSVPDVTTETPSTPAKDGSTTQAAQPTAEAPSATAGYQQPTTATHVESTTAAPAKSTTTTAHEPATEASETTTEAPVTTTGYQQPPTSTPVESTTTAAPEQTTAEESTTTVESTTAVALEESTTTLVPEEFTTEAAPVEPTTKAAAPPVEATTTAVPESATVAPESTTEALGVTSAHQQPTTAGPDNFTTMPAPEDSTTMAAAPVESPSTEAASPVESTTTAEPAPATETLEPTTETPMTTMDYQQPTTATTKEPTTIVTSVEPTTTAASESTEAPKPASDAPEPTTEAPVTIYYHQSTATPLVESTTKAASQSTEAPEPATKAPEPTADVPVTTAGYQQPTTVTTKKPTTTVAPVESTKTAGPTVESSTKAVTEESTATIAPEPTAEASGQTSGYQQLTTTLAPEGSAATAVPAESITAATEPATGVSKPTAETLETTGYQQPTATTSAAPAKAVTPEESTTTLEESAATLEESATTAEAAEESTTAPVLSPADSLETSPAFGSATVATDEEQSGSPSTTNSSTTRPTDVQAAISPENLKPVESTNAIRPPKVPLKIHPVIPPVNVQIVSSNKPVQPVSAPVKTPPISTTNEVSPDFPEENRLEIDVLPPSPTTHARPSAIASDVEEVKTATAVRPAAAASDAQPANNARPDVASARPTNVTAGVIPADGTTNERPTSSVVGVKPASTTASVRPPFVFIHARPENAAAKIPSFPARVEVNSTKDAKIRSNTTDPSAEVDLPKSGETSKVEPVATTEVKTPSAPYQAATVGTNTTHTLPITPSTHSSSVNTSHYQPPVKPASKVPTDIHSPSQPHSTDKSQQSVPVSKVQSTKPDTKVSPASGSTKVQAVSLTKTVRPTSNVLPTSNVKPTSHTAKTRPVVFPSRTGRPSSSPKSPTTQTEARSRPFPIISATPSGLELSDSELLNVLEEVLEAAVSGSDLDPYPGSLILPLGPGPEGGLVTRVRKVSNVVQLLRERGRV